MSCDDLDVLYNIYYGDATVGKTRYFIKNGRNRKNIMLEKVTEGLKTTKATLSLYENNLCNSKVDFAKQIEDYLQWSADYLLDPAHNRMGIIVQDIVEDNDINIEIHKNFYSEQLTHEKVVEILDKLNKVGFKWDSSNK